MNTQKDRREFGFVPGEYEYPPVGGIPVQGDEAAGSGDAPVEFEPPSPEIVGPGEYVYKASQKKKRDAAKLTAIIAILTIVLGISNPFADSGDQSAAAEEPGQEAAESVPEQESTAEETSIEESQAEASAAEDSQSSQAEISQPEEPVVYVEPQCDIVLIGMASEMTGGIAFSDLDDAQSIHIEIWDPLTDYMFEAFDVLPSELEDNRYNIPTFTTEHFYDANQAYYEGIEKFPFDAEVRVQIAYGSAEEPEIREFSQRSIQEESFWYIYYDTSTDTMWGYPESYVFQIPPAAKRTTIVVDQPELVTKESDTVSLRLVIDGAEVPESDYDIRYTESQGEIYDMNGEMTYSGTVYDARAIIYHPFTAGVQHEGTLYVTQYLESYDRVWTTETELGFYQDNGT